MPADTFSNAYLDDINVCVTGFSFGQVEYTEDVYADIMPQMEDAVNILLAHGGDEEAYSDQFPTNGRGRI